MLAVSTDVNTTSPNCFRAALIPIDNTLVVLLRNHDYPPVLPLPPIFTKIIPGLQSLSNPHAS